MSRIAGNWIRPDDPGSLKPDVRYATLIRDKKCLITGKTPKEAKLEVRRRTETGCWVLDNTMSTVKDALNC
jgi:hypothetical protein